MGLRYYKNKNTGDIKRSLSKLSKDEWEEVLVAPNQKFMITANKGTGTSKVKNATKQLTSRSRNHSRDVDLDDNIQLNKANGLNEQVERSLLNNKRERRRKIDDI